MLLKSVSGDSAQNLKTRRIEKTLLIYQKMKQNNIFIRNTGTISSLFLSQKLKRLFFVDENNGQASNAYQVTFEAATPNYVSGTYLVNAQNGDMLKNMVQESNLKASDKLVGALKKK